LKRIVTSEISNTSDPNIIFRSNLFSSKSIEHFIRNVGTSYLKNTIGNIIHLIYFSKQSCEMDTLRIMKDPHGDVKKNLSTLMKYVTSIWEEIQNSVELCPTKIRQILHFISIQVIGKWGEDSNVKYSSISAFFFLRFFCPAIMNPQLYGIEEDHPNALAARNLTLISKTMMNLANLVGFGQKEPYMLDVNTFIEENKEDMMNFLSQISILSASKVFPDIKIVPHTAAKIFHHCEDYIDELSLVKDKNGKVEILIKEVQQLGAMGRKGETARKTITSFGGQYKNKSRNSIS